MDPARVNMALAASEHRNLAQCVAECPGAAHPTWASEEVALLNRQTLVHDPTSTLTIILNAARLPPHGYSPPGELNPFNITRDDVIAANKHGSTAVKAVPLVRVVP